jgi:diguanylate cyclase (GGDEF)-like protein
VPEAASIQLPTLYLSGALSGVLAAFILMMPGGPRDTDRDAVSRFGLALALGAIMMFTLWLNGRVSARGPIPIAAIAAMAQATLLAHASTRLFGGRLPGWVTLLALGVALPAYFAAAAFGSPATRVAVVCALQAVFCGLAALHALRARDPVGAGFRRGFALLYGLIATLIALLTVELLTIGPQDGARGVFMATRINLFTALVGSISPLLTALIVLGVLNARMSDRLLKLALTDELTGVHTRRHLLEAAPEIIARLRARGSRAAVMMFDLDHFKRVNDVHGHQVGDRVLRHAAAIMRKALRADSLLARYGGEEFCAIVPAGDEVEALAAAERVRGALASRPIALNGVSIALTVSIGVAVQRGDLRFDELLVLADDHVYAAKTQGRNRVVGVAAPRGRRPDRRLAPARNSV